MVTVRVESKSGVAEGVLRTALVPEGAPEMVKATGELNPLSEPT